MSRWERRLRRLRRRATWSQIRWWLLPRYSLQADVPLFALCVNLGPGKHRYPSSYVSSSTSLPASPSPSSQQHFGPAKRVYAPVFRPICVRKLGERLIHGGDPALTRCF
ncbi:uncharacterized protein ARMOST_19078 [Armillaria ostoyae]|uniref:Uncharacterized protein n=1 Tax=Armillaria ostoyae TaxID=47428 RepID=A0A284S3M7_ARMOS|nr:uncharacterized protein ARMOST_19078 [Armillaria ostoyae]